MTRHDVFIADECFLTGTAAEVIPVIKADGRTIGTGKPGAITARMIAPVPRNDARDGHADFFLMHLRLRARRRRCSQRVVS